MSKIAIIVVLLPPEDIMDLCIDINQKSSDTFSKLNKTDNLPHITLAMGVADENDLEKINEKIKIITGKFNPLDLEISRIDYTVNLKNNKAVGLIIRTNQSLIDLHGQVMKELLPILSYDEVNSDMFYRDSNEEIDELSKSWVRNYGQAHNNPDNYHPHISLKCRDAQYNNFPARFIVTKVAVCQLGKYGTCRKIFKSFEIK
jgi:2'-5' RNA ligase